jgi:hypothetical protein
VRLSKGTDAGVEIRVGLPKLFGLLNRVELLLELVDAGIRELLGVGLFSIIEGLLRFRWLAGIRPFCWRN